MHEELNRRDVLKTVGGAGLAAVFGARALQLLSDEAEAATVTTCLLTPEATEAVCEKMLDGFGEQMRAVSLKVVPTAILSRQVAGIRGKSLIVNLPGKPSAIRDCLMAVFPAIPYCIDLIEGPFLTTNEAVVKAFRPKQ